MQDCNSDCNSIVNYGNYMIVYHCQGKLKGRKWCYSVVNIGGPGPIPIPGPVGLQNNQSISVIIPLCNDLKSWKVRCRRVACAEDFSTKVGLDPDTGIYGIRFDVINPCSNFTICFKTPKRKAVNQNLGLIVNGMVYNFDVICSPGCK